VPPPSGLGSHCEKEIQRLREHGPVDFVYDIYHPLSEEKKREKEEKTNREIDRLTAVKKFGYDWYAKYLEKVMLDEELASLPQWVKPLVKLMKERKEMDEKRRPESMSSPKYVDYVLKELDEKLDQKMKKFFKKYPEAEAAYLEDDSRYWSARYAAQDGGEGPSNVQVVEVGGSGDGGPNNVQVDQVVGSGDGGPSNVEVDEVGGSGDDVSIEKLMSIAKVKTPAKLKELICKVAEYQKGQKKALEVEKKLKAENEKKRKLVSEVEKIDENIVEIEKEQTRIVDNITTKRRKFIDKRGYGQVEAISTARPMSKSAKKRLNKKNSNSVACALTFETPK
jgi:translation initiation factor 2B subunit (eIF-2B alpha/beta/delta family)